MTKDKAEEVALRALSWIVTSEDIMSVFLGATGSTVQMVKEQADDPAFLSSVLDFLLMDDAWVTGFCDANNLDYRQPLLARQHLPGGDIPNWT